jgi:hypothetical protein
MPDTLPRHRMTWRVVFGGALLAVAAGLAACGSYSGTSGGSQVTSVTTRTITSGTPTANPASSQTPATATPGAVRLVLRQTHFKPGDIVTVNIENGLARTISTTDHHSSCTLIQLEKLVNGSWQSSGTCHLMTPTRVVDLAAGSVTPQKVGLPTEKDAAGTYRMMLMYGVSGQSAGSSAGPAYSATFTVS